MRILHVISGVDPTSGGPAAVLLGLTCAQANSGLQVSIASTWVVPPSPEALSRLEAHAAVHSLGSCHDPMSRHPDLPAWIDSLVANADIVHIHAMWESIQHYAARAAHRRGIPYLITPHGMLDRWNMSNGWLKKRLYLLLRMNRNLRQASAIHFATAQEQAWTLPLPLPQRQIIEPFGIDWNEFDHLPAPGTFRQQFPIIAGQPFILFLGRIDRGKGWEYLIPAFASAATTPGLKDWLLVIAGPDYFRNQAKAEQLAKDAGIRDRVLFTGMLSSPQRLAALADCELLALPSCHENFGIVVAEAMAAGKPVIVSDQVALHHEVRQWNAGGVVALDIPQIAQTLRQWMLDPAARTAAGTAARAMARQHFDWTVIAQHWKQHYQTTLTR